MKLSAQILILTATLSLSAWGCRSENPTSLEEFEKEVFHEVFPQFLDSVRIENYLIPPPPPPPSPEILKEKGYDVSGGYGQGVAAWMKSEAYANLMKDWETRRDSAQKDTASLYIVIQDSISRYEPNDFYELMEHFQEENILLDSDEIGLKQGYRIDLEKLHANHPRIRFRYRSEFPRGNDIWRNRDSIGPLLSIGHTRILFDKTRSFGVFSIGVVRGRLDASGYRVFIRKDQTGKWVIDEIKNTWIS